MEVKAKLRYLRISARKVRLVTNLVKNLPALEAVKQLKFLPKRSAEPVLKLINSALANAEKNHQLEKNNLYIKEIKVDSGPILKRWLPRARGHADVIRKRTAHISVKLDEIKPSSKKIKADKNQAQPEVVKMEEVEKELGGSLSQKDGLKKGWTDEIKKSKKEASSKGRSGGAKIFRRKSF